MNVDTLKETFYELVAPDIPNEWDVEDALQDLANVDERNCSRAFQQVQVIWPVSHSLCFDYLRTVASALDCLEPDNLPEWVNSTLDQYEKKGLRAAQKYMADVEANFLCPRRKESGMQFKDVYGRLLPYLRGLSGEPLDIAPGNDIFTDTSTIFIPKEISRYSDDADNVFLYKLIVSYQWGYIACGSYIIPEMERQNKGESSRASSSLWLQYFFRSFANEPLAAELYHLLETIRVTQFLEEELPGLMRRKKFLFEHDDMQRHDHSTCCQPIAIMRDFIHCGVNLNVFRRTDPVSKLVLEHKTQGKSAQDSIALTQLLYDMIAEKAYNHTAAVPLLYQGEMRLDAVRHARDKRLEVNKELFIDALTTHLIQLPKNKAKDKVQTEKAQSQDGSGDDSGTTALIMDSQAESNPNAAESTTTITIDNEQLEMYEDLQAITNSIANDLGYLPQQYISSAVGRAGKGYTPFQTMEAEKGTALSVPVAYDEWDYRRNDFRKKWVSVIEKPIPLTSSALYSATLRKYHGQIIRLRYQFEMMRTTERFVRRQRDGEDIDVDSLIESMADVRAGLAPSERLFVRLQRDVRDIAVLFLIDMSNSTQGWVNEAIKESLVLLCEALEVVGDRYAIYGFSGMRRLRSELFHIKHLDEPYDDTVKQRITSIAPREYTRMGSALRHATELLRGVDSRVRLLITISDGKPEDYDDYKGEYAIEDTRHALFEAKAAGIHPFCITIDKHAQEYINHMYGSVNYIQIDDVKKLPQKMPEIYRILTR